MNSEFIYAAVNCAGYRPLFLSEQLHYAENSLSELYGIQIELDPKDIATRIERVLIDCRAMQAGNIVHIYFTPEGKYTIRYIQSTIYSTYAHLGVKTTAVLQQYELPLEGHRTAISLATADYMKRLAIGRGAHLTIRVNSAENVISVGDYPIVIVENSRIILPQGAPFCFEIELLNRLCRLAKVSVSSETVDIRRFLKADGAFVFGVWGIQSVASCSSTLFSHSMANHLERFFPQLK